MRLGKIKAGLLLLSGLLALGLLALAWAIGTGSSEAQQDAMQNCPQAGKWAISVWSGDDGTDTGQALATCGTGVVDMVYYIDPDTQAWSRYFVGRVDISNLLTLDDMQGVITRGAMVGPPPAATPTVPPGGTWTGVWSTNWGNMELTQSDSSVTGTYIHDQGHIEGTVQGNKLIGTWSESPSYAPPDDAGEFEFTMYPDGNSFLGRWRYDSAGDWDEWSASRIQ
jgi:hypothetical protein